MFLQGSVYFIVKTALGMYTKRKGRTAEKKLHPTTLPTAQLLVGRVVGHSFSFGFLAMVAQFLLRNSHTLFAEDKKQYFHWTSYVAHSKQKVQLKNVKLSELSQASNNGECLLLNR